jgi:E3 ubiquitin-protein ligase Arkadia
MPGLHPLPYYYHAQGHRYAEQYFRIYPNPRHSAPQNRGASRSTIERNTFAHKYKRMKKSIDDEREDDIEKCTICLCEFEMEEDVRFVSVSCYLLL